MAVTGYLYHSFPQAALKKLISDLSDASTSIKVALCTSSYTPSQSSHTSYNDLTNELSTGNGYTAGGAALANKTCEVTAGVTAFNADDVTWANSTLTARYAVIYDDTPAAAANKKLIMYLDFGTDYSTSSSTFMIVFNSSGIFSFTVA